MATGRPYGFSRLSGSVCSLEDHAARVRLEQSSGQAVDDALMAALTNAIEPLGTTTQLTVDRSRKPGPSRRVQLQLTGPQAVLLSAHVLGAGRETDGRLLPPTLA